MSDRHDTSWTLRIFDRFWRRWSSRPLPVRILLAAAIVAAATVMQFALGYQLLQGTAFLLYYPSICIIALLCGGWLGITAALVESVLAVLFFLPAASPMSSLLVRPLIFFVFSAIVSFLTDAVVRSRSQLRALREQSKLLFDTNILGIIHWNLSGSIIDANDAFLRIIGYTRDDLREGRIDWRSLTPPEWAAADARLVLELKATGKHAAFEKEYLKKDGQRVPIVVGSAAYPGSIHEGLSFILDITEQKTAQRQLERTRDELRTRVQELDRSNADLAQFAYVASHDLKEPLRVVRAHLQFVERSLGGHVPPKAALHMGMVMEASERMYRLIDDLLEYARVGVETAKAVTVDMNSVAAEVVEGLSARVAETGARVSVGALPSACGVPTQLRQVLQNLVENALKFHGCDRMPIVTVTGGTNDGAFATYSVRDNGIGIAPEYAGRIFEIFQRLHDRGSYSGTGIGLSVCKRIVERHGGRIWVESSPGRGADFRFTLPRAKESP